MAHVYGGRIFEESCGQRKVDRLRQTDTFPGHLMAGQGLEDGAAKQLRWTIDRFKIDGPEE